ncbi:endonuclease/exonuclease/phosphatase family protein-like protein [Setomelanomma holmii]|uniref:Endonuclease/exonuclease/phosphatase family protein-like protein n=1 Tax=Setomelanomma holmii TaxID=210430 RepID=A0A9P4HL41_9PLEO|nr:endonuclease/exonuclease/phosphatase family protein-like protein [Setomelanomma holmii]
MRSSIGLIAILLWIASVLAQTSGTFNVLSFNVAGLPPILNSNEVPGDKTENTARIGQLFTQYDFSLIHVQEDFNFHATLYANDNHPYRTATSGGVPFGSGLNSLSNYEFTAFDRVKWNTCSNTDSADCLTPKGFTFMRVKFAAGGSVDAYNLHADAGTTAADLVARASNLVQVSDYIKANSIGNAVLVFGDSNTRYTRAEDNPGVFAAQNGMEDVWVELIRNGVPPVGGSDALLCDNPSQVNTCETVDKVWYRGSPAVGLQATNFDYVGDMFLQANGSILSDHNPVLVNFAWTLNAKTRVSETFGGEYGTWFNGLSSVSALSSATVSSVTLHGAERVDSVALTLASGQTFTHGGTGGTATTLTLQTREKLTGATLCRGDKDGKTRIFYAELRTSASRSVSTGVKTSDCVERTAESGWAITGFLGRDGDEVDMLGLVYSKA